MPNPEQPTTGRYGRRSPKNAPALRLGPLLTGTLPAPPTKVDYGTDFAGWQMLGNDVAGDCVAVTWANQRALVTTALSQKTDYPSQTEVWALYRTQNPNFDPNGSAISNGPGSPADGGMDIQTALEYLVGNGGPDGVRAAAFAKVDFTNENELRSAHAIFGQVWYGVNVLVANQTEFSNGQAWDYVAGSPLDGGHSITGVGYDPSDYRFVTWAQETDWTEGFRTHQVEEAWVVIWPEHLGTTQFEQGINVQQLATDYEAITGQTLAIPGPPYQRRILDTGTTFSPESDGVWLMADYDRDGIPDLVFIKTSNTGTGTVEVHIASGASNYQKRILDTGTTFSPESDGVWLMADYDRDGIPDLVFTRTSNTGTGTVEVHIASGA